MYRAQTTTTHQHNPTPPFDARHYTAFAPSFPNYRLSLSKPILPGRSLPTALLSFSKPVSSCPFPLLKHRPALVPYYAAHRPWFPCSCSRAETLPVARCVALLSGCLGPKVSTTAKAHTYHIIPRIGPRPTHRRAAPRRTRECFIDRRITPTASVAGHCPPTRA